ncbi:DUF1454 family protein [Tatumella sp. UCD-D_suzukii]|uniref:DUF1454 family protein n=1 Tax=Tatumella sp. UCD-D_suzukii TaxID=1408192 RepID=UPI00046EAFBE|nr:DUF1454 family protein [Tatumella sp. UCD-D_suzukii]
MKNILRKLQKRVYRGSYYGLVFCLFSGGILAKDLPPVAPYVLPGAPVFSHTIAQFRENFNTVNPQMPLPEYRTVDTGDDGNTVILAASRIDETLYSSTALEPGCGKIKTIQMTWLAPDKGTDKHSFDQATGYMMALIHFFSPELSLKESQQKLDSLLKNGKEKGRYIDAEGALRYVVSYQGDRELTLAIEPVRLILPGS